MALDVNVNIFYTDLMTSTLSILPLIDLLNTGGLNGCRAIEGPRLRIVLNAFTLCYGCQIFIQSFIYKIYIAPPQENYSEAFPVQPR